MKKIILLMASVVLMSCQESLEEKAAHETQIYTQRNCPARIDDNIVMDSLTFDAATHTLKYYYTLTGLADTVGILDKVEARKALLGELRNTTSMAAYKDAGYNFAYYYRSQKHPDMNIFETTFSEKDYKKKVNKQNK